MKPFSKRKKSLFPIQQVFKFTASRAAGNLGGGRGGGGILENIKSVVDMKQHYFQGSPNVIMTTGTKIPFRIY